MVVEKVKEGIEVIGEELMRPSSKLGAHIILLLEN